MSKQVAVLEVMSGPQDGRIIPIENETFFVGPIPGSLVTLDYDDRVPKEGVKIMLGETSIIVGEEGEKVPYGNLFRIGQVWLRIIKSERSERV